MDLQAEGGSPLDQALFALGDVQCSADEMGFLQPLSFPSWSLVS